MQRDFLGENPNGLIFDLLDPAQAGVSVSSNRRTRNMAIRTAWAVARLKSDLTRL
jgi:hypothetical protein